MASGTTTVGSVKYDASIDLAQLKKSLSEADKLVKKSYDNQAKAAKQAAKTGSSKSSSSSPATSGTEAQVRVNNIKREAQETAKALATYTPQIQKQFLTVERANNQVTSASTRATNAIQKYGSGSAQATQATNALNVAVGNQSQQQAKLTSMLNGSYKSQNSFTSSMADSVVAIGGVVAGLTVLNTAMNTIQNSVKVANQFEASIAGLSRISERFGYDATTATQAAQSLAEDGLITVSTAAEGLQKLLTSGVGLPEAIKLMQGYKDQAAFGKSSTIDFNTAVGNLAESFYTENSAIGNLSGQTENWNQILEYGASVLGKNVSQLSEKERVQAKLIGQQRLNNLVEGDSAVLAETNAGKQARLNQTLLEMQTTIGRVTNQIQGGFIGALGGMNEEGQKTAIAFGAGVTAFVGFLTIVPLAITGFRAIRTALAAVGVASAFASGGITAIVGGLAALGAGIGVAALIDNLDTTEELSEDFSQNVNEAAGGLSNAASGAADTAKQLKKINEQMEDARENYRYSLAQLVAEKNENIATLTKTLTEEERAYNNAYNERLTSFNKTQNEELLTHQQKTRALQNQIDFLTKYNTQANQEQLSELQFALARENAEYQKSTELRQDEFDAQTQSAKDEYEARRQENQKKLNEELALLNKHRADVLAVRGVMLRDEIEQLKYARDEQLKSLEQQKQSAASYGASTGKAFGEAYKWQLIESTKLSAEEAKKVYSGGTTSASIQTYQDSKGNVQRVIVPHFAKGVNDFGGGLAVVGEKGPELVNLPRGTDVIPNHRIGDVNSSTTSTTNVNLNLAGLVFNTKSDKRQFATEIAKLINESTKAKIGTVSIQGV